MTIRLPLYIYSINKTYSKWRDAVNLKDTDRVVSDIAGAALYDDLSAREVPQSHYQAAALPVAGAAVSVRQKLAW